MKCKYMFMLPPKNLARKGLKVSVVVDDSLAHFGIKTYKHVDLRRLGRIYASVPHICVSESGQHRLR